MNQITVFDLIEEVKEYDGGELFKYRPQDERNSINGNIELIKPTKQTIPQLSYLENFYYIEYCLSSECKKKLFAMLMEVKEPVMIKIDDMFLCDNVYHFFKEHDEVSKWLVCPIIFGAKKDKRKSRKAKRNYIEGDTSIVFQRGQRMVRDKNKWKEVY